MAMPEEIDADRMGMFIDGSGFVFHGKISAHPPLQDIIEALAKILGQVPKEVKTVVVHLPE